MPSVRHRRCDPRHVATIVIAGKTGQTLSITRDMIAAHDAQRCYRIISFELGQNDNRGSDSQDEQSNKPELHP